ncbi:nucleoside triphosphate pyrophosphatase [Corynebacterium auriscanis]|uniref:nucleoside triphosphate pyrophosphatase n=1 Tax=Corynebacterium auriscanis TaxID=99807 RepID=UPI003CF3D7D6
MLSVASSKESYPHPHNPQAAIGQRLQVVLASTSPSRLSILRSAGVEPIVIASGVDEDAVVADLRTRVGEPSPKDVVAALAEAKAQAVVDELRADSPGAAALTGPAVLIGGDSMLLIDGELQGKPHTAEETVKRWRNQRGKMAELLTGHAVYYLPARAERQQSGPVDALTQQAKPVDALTQQAEVAGAAQQETTTASAGNAPHPTSTAKLLWRQDPYVEVSTTTLLFANASDADIHAYAATGEPFGCAGAFTLEALGGWFIDRIEGDPSSVIGLSLLVVRRALEHFGYSAQATWSRG